MLAAVENPGETWRYLVICYGYHDCNHDRITSSKYQVMDLRVFIRGFDQSPQRPLMYAHLVRTQLQFAKYGELPSCLFQKKLQESAFSLATYG